MLFDIILNNIASVAQRIPLLRGQTRVEKNTTSIKHPGTNTIAIFTKYG